jgi:NEMP family
MRCITIVAACIFVNALVLSLSSHDQVDQSSSNPSVVLPLDLEICTTQFPNLLSKSSYSKVVLENPGISFVDTLYGNIKDLPEIMVNADTIHPIVHAFFESIVASLIQGIRNLQYMFSEIHIVGYKRKGNENVLLQPNQFKIVETNSTEYDFNVAETKDSFFSFATSSSLSFLEAFNPLNLFVFLFDLTVVKAPLEFIALFQGAQQNKFTAAIMNIGQVAFVKVREFFANKTVLNVIGTKYSKQMNQIPSILSISPYTHSYFAIQYNPNTTSSYATTSSTMDSLEQDEKVYFTCQTNFVSMRYVIFLVIGMFLAFSAKDLSESMVLYYSTGVFGGFILALVLLLLILYKNKRMSVFFFTSGGVATWFLSFFKPSMYNSFLSFALNNTGILTVCYFLITTLVVVTFLYVRGPIQNTRIFTLIEYMLHLIAIICISNGFASSEIAIAAIVIIYISNTLTSFVKFVGSCILWIFTLLTCNCFMCRRMFGHNLSQKSHDLVGETPIKTKNEKSTRVTTPMVSSSTRYISLPASSSVQAAQTSTTVMGSQYKQGTNQSTIITTPSTPRYSAPKISPNKGAHSFSLSSPSLMFQEHESEVVATGRPRGVYSSMESVVKQVPPPQVLTHRRIGGGGSKLLAVHESARKNMDRSIGESMLKKRTRRWKLQPPSGLLSYVFTPEYHPGWRFWPFTYELNNGVELDEYDISNPDHDDAVLHERWPNLLEDWVLDEDQLMERTRLRERNEWMSDDEEDIEVMDGYEQVRYLEEIARKSIGANKRRKLSTS